MEQIPVILEELEKKYNITILYACESGSRAWGFASNDSDYDIRFIYKHNDIKKYITIGAKRETIDGFSDDRIYDWGGWDIKKALKHVKESNPSIMEWVQSPIVYLDRFGFKDQCRDLLNKIHTKLSLMYHYKSMALSNWMDHIQDKEIVNIKKYFYVIRPVAMLHRLLTIDDKPLEIEFTKVIEEIKTDMDKDTYDSIYELLKRKMEGVELGQHERIKEIDKWILNVFERFEGFTNTNSKKVNEQSTISLYKKIQNEYKKIRSIHGAHGKVNRNNYLTIIGFCLQFIWLQQHQESNYRHIPSHISSLLQDVEIDTNISNEIKNIINLKNELDGSIVEIIQTGENDKLFKKHKLLDLMIKDMFIKIWLSLAYPTKEINTEDLSIETCLELLEDYMPVDICKKIKQMYYENTRMPRDDIIDFFFKNYFLSFIWLLENNESTVQKIPKDIINNVTLDQDIKKNIEKILVENKIGYKMTMNDIVIDWVEKLIKDNEEFMEKRIQENLKIRDENIKNRYNDSLKDISEDNFDDILYRHIMD